MRLRRTAVVRWLVRTVGRGRLIVVLRVLELPLRGLVRAMVRRVRRDPRLVVLGAPLDSFADNCAYLFLHLSGDPELRCVWVSGSRELVARLRAAGHEAERRLSLRGLRVCLRAGWYVVSSYVSDVNRWTHDGARVLNLWHGVPLKTIERDIGDGSLSLLYRPRPRRSPVALALIDQVTPPDALLSSSRFVSERCFSSAFALPVERCLDVGYPRTDHFFAPAPEPPDALLVAEPDRWHRAREARFVVGYFPTWRDDDAPFIARSGLSIAKLSRVVEQRGGVLLFKPHINTAVDPGDAAGTVLIDPADDLNAYLPLCSALVTDYSSVAFDFMLLGRPILYFVPDLDDYRRGRGLYFDPSEMMPGPLLRTAEELYGAVAELGPHSPPDPRLGAVRDRVWGDYRGGAGARLREFLVSASTSE